MASHVTNLATGHEDPMPIRSWVTSYNVSRSLLSKMRTRPLRMRRITWPMSRGRKRLHFWNSRPRFAYSLYNFGGSTMNIIKVICENNAHHVLKNVWGSAHARNHVIYWRCPKCRSGRRRFTVLDFKSWAYSRIYGHFQQHLHCACEETVIYELPV